MTITKEHFDAAVEQPWDTETCILAQAAPCSIVWPYKAVKTVMFVFDEHFRVPGDELKPELQALRASLPLTFE